MPSDTLDRQKNKATINKFGSQGILLFLDQLLGSVGGWIYWLLIVPRTSPFEFGQATAVYGYIVLASTLTTLGLEFPLLKRSSTQQGQILGTILAIELLILLSSLPVIFYFINDLFQGSSRFSWLSSILIVFSSLGFVIRFALLGISDMRNILLIDSVGIGIRFVSGYILVSIGFGAFGILLSILLQSFLVTIGTFIAARKRFGLRIGNIRYIKEVIRDGLVNAPSKFSRTLILSLSIVMLASFGVSTSEIGVFYIALMISIFATSGLASSLAYMAIPASTISRFDLYSDSMRIGVSMTAPLISALIASPSLILSIVGSQYLSGESTLLVLSIGILPSIITINAISRFNYIGKSIKLLSIGCTEVLTFLIAFCLLVPSYGSLGAAFSTLIGFASSSLLSIVWSEKKIVRYIGVSALAIMAGSISAYVIGSITTINSLESILISINITILIIIISKNISASEFRDIYRNIKKGVYQ